MLADTIEATVVALGSNFQNYTHSHDQLDVRMEDTSIRAIVGSTQVLVGRRKAVADAIASPTRYQMSVAP